MTISKMMADRAILDYNSLCIAIMDAVYSSKKPELKEYVTTQITRIEKDIENLKDPTHSFFIESVKHFYELDWKPDVFYEPLNMLKEEDPDSALEKLTEMSKTIKDKIARHFHSSRC